MTINNESLEKKINVDNKLLVECAKETMKNAYAVYSQFKVGAALLTENNKIFTGCNVENASFGATICAERTAVVKAISEGEKKLMKIAIVSSSGEKTPPCGMCLQVLHEFMDKDARIILADDNGIYEYELKDFMPTGFSFKIKK